MADEYWKKYLTGTDPDDWYYGSEPEYQFTGWSEPTQTTWGSSESISQVDPTALEGWENLDSSEWYSQDQAFLDMPDPSWKDFELGQGDYVGSWETEAEKRAIEGTQTWAEWWDEAGLDASKALGLSENVVKTLMTMAEGMKLGDTGGGGRGGLTGARARTKAATGVGGPPGTMSKSAEVRSALSKIGSGGSKYSPPANKYFASGEQNRLMGNAITSGMMTAMKEAAGGKGSKTLLLDKALRQLPIPKTARFA